MRKYSSIDSSISSDKSDDDEDEDLDEIDEDENDPNDFDASLSYEFAKFMEDPLIREGQSKNSL
jgi:hypothetical protein